jgi:hypothetical protein
MQSGPNATGVPLACSEITLVWDDLGQLLCETCKADCMAKCAVGRAESHC